MYIGRNGDISIYMFLGLIIFNFGGLGKMGKYVFP